MPQSGTRHAGQRPAAGRAAGACLGPELDRGGDRLARGDALEPASRRRRHRHGHFVRRGAGDRAQPEGAARRIRPHHDRRFFQRRGVSGSLGLRAIERRHHARHHHHLFDADLDTVLSRFVLGEQLTAMRWFAFGLCVAGVVILVAPLFDAGFPPFVFYSLGCALSWTIATVYIKWAKVTVAPLPMRRGNCCSDCCSSPPARSCSKASRISGRYATRRYSRFCSSDCRRRPRAFPVVVDRRPAAGDDRLARLAAGAGDRRHRLGGHAGRAPDAPGHLGFALIFAAAACVLLQPNVKHTEMPE